MTSRTLTSARHTSTPSRVRAQHRFAREESDGRRERSSSAGGQMPVLAHESVMVGEALELLAPKDGEVVVDCTAGQGGHSVALLSRAPQVQLLALDADPAAVAAVRAKLKPFGARAAVVEANFADLGHVLRKEGLQTIHKALFDLGWNLTQLASGRGFSFLHDEPLVMSYGAKPLSGFTAAEILNEWKEEDIANALFGYAQERYARRIASAVVARREVRPIESTIELVELVRDAVPAAYRRSKINPATRTFQALRIAVNDEFGAIERGLTAAWEHLAEGGRIVVITFHSSEDRLVKQLFARFAKEGGSLLTKKPLVPSLKELTSNSRARSAKVRAIEKLCKR